MKNACFLVPIHPPKFNYGIQFLTSYNQLYEDDHVFLVFTTNEEKEEFKKLAGDLRYRSIVCGPLSGNSPTTEKKFLGLNIVFRDTDFENVGVVDIDSEFIQHVDYSDLFEKYNKRGIIYGNKYDYAPKPIIMSPLKFFNPYDQGRLHEITRDFSVYFWFNDLPVYNKRHFQGFMKHINFHERSRELVWFDFDFIIYGYYLLLTNAFRLEILMLDNKPLNAIFIEDQHRIPANDFERVFEICKPMWVQSNVDPRLMGQTFMHVHVDRS